MWMSIHKKKTVGLFLFRLFSSHISLCCLKHCRNIYMWFLPAQHYHFQSFSVFQSQSVIYQSSQKTTTTTRMKKKITIRRNKRNKMHKNPFKKWDSPFFFCYCGCCCAVSICRVFRLLIPALKLSFSYSYHAWILPCAMCLPTNVRKKMEKKEEMNEMVKKEASFNNKMHPQQNAIRQLLMLFTFRHIKWNITQNVSPLNHFRFIWANSLSIKKKNKRRAHFRGFVWSE